MVRFRFLLVYLLLCSPVMAEQKIILVLGDSLSEGHGIGLQQGWVALLEDKLQSKEYKYSVINSSISGDTTYSAKLRLKNILQQRPPEIAIVELGGNDGLRGLSIAQTRSNLADIITQLQSFNAKVVLLGMRLPPNYGQSYTRQFHKIYLDLAKEYSVSLVPFFLEGVAGVPGMMQADGIHPAAQGQLRMLDNVWPILKPIL